MDHHDKETIKTIAAAFAVVVLWFVAVFAISYGISSIDKEKANTPSAWEKRP